MCSSNGGGKGCVASRSGAGKGGGGLYVVISVGGGIAGRVRLGERGDGRGGGGFDWRGLGSSDSGIRGGEGIGRM